jgi:hypothetical protein
MRMELDARARSSRRSSILFRSGLTPINSSLIGIVSSRLWLVGPRNEGKVEIWNCICALCEVYNL